MLKDSLDNKILYKDITIPSNIYAPRSVIVSVIDTSINGYEAISCTPLTMADSGADALWFSVQLTYYGTWVLIENKNPSATYSGYLLIRVYYAKTKATSSV